MNTQPPDWREARDYFTPRLEGIVHTCHAPCLACEQAGRAAALDRIRDRLFELHKDATTHGGWMPGWHKFADLLGG